jgi:hypothetical protein
MTDQQQMTDNITKRWHTRGTLSPSQKAWLRNRGVPAAPWVGNHDENIRRLRYAGFDKSVLVSGFYLDHQYADLSETWDDANGDLIMIVQLNADGLTPSEISEETGLGRQNIYYHLKHLGLRAHNIRDPLTQDQKIEIVNRRGGGGTVRSISEEMGLTYHRVRYALSKYYPEEVST